MTESELQQAPNQKGEDFQPAGGRNIAALKRIEVYNNFLYQRNSNVHLPGVHWRNMGLFYLPGSPISSAL